LHVKFVFRPANSSALDNDPNRSRGAASPGLKVTIKNTTTTSTDRSAPAVTIQNYSSPSSEGSKKSSSSSSISNHKSGSSNSSNHSSSSSKAAHKINERFITDPGAAQRSEERKRSSDSFSSGGSVSVVRRKLGTGTDIFPFTFFLFGGSALHFVFSVHDAFRGIAVIVHAVLIKGAPDIRPDNPAIVRNRYPAGRIY
jgi:hypothetical protein